MEKAKAWLKAHWKPVLAVVLAAAVGLWLLLRKSKSPATALTLPAMAGGGAAGGSSSGSSSTLSQSANLPPATPTVGASGVAKHPGLRGLPPVRHAADAQKAPLLRWTGISQRGSGFRGGDVYPPFAGLTARALGAARDPKETAGPAPALGTPILPKQLTARDVRASTRRQTAMTQLARTNDPVPLPQSFSVPIREHQEGSRRVVSIQAQTPVDATQAPDPQTPMREEYTAPAIPPSMRRRWRYQ